MSGGVRAAWQWLAEAPRQRTGTRMLQRVLGAVLLFRVATEAAWAPLLWGPGGWTPGSSAVLRNAAPLARVFSSDGRVYLALGVLALGAALLVLGAATRLGALLALLPFWLLYNRAPLVNDGGDNVMRLLLIYLLLFTSARGAVGPLRSWVHNLGVVLVVGQACVIYFAAAVNKASGELWINGTALYFVSQLELFTPSWLQGLLQRPALVTLATHAVVLLQGWLPVVLISRVRRPWLLMLLGFHLWTLLGMGLVTFGGCMTGLVLFLVSDEEYALLARAGTRAVAGVRAHLAQRAGAEEGP